MAWEVLQGIQMLDTGVLVAPRTGLDEFEQMLADPVTRRAVAEWGLGAIADGSWRDLALTLVDSTTRDCFVENWDHPQILAGFENVLRKVIATGLPVKVTGLVGDFYAVVSSIVGEHHADGYIAVTVWAPATT